MTLAADDLNDTDTRILAMLAEGRCTPRYLAGELGQGQPYISQRLKRLREHGHIKRVDRGLYELVDDPRDADGDESATDAAQAGADDSGGEETVTPPVDADTDREALAQLDTDRRDYVRQQARRHLGETYSTWGEERVEDGAAAVVAAYEYLREEGSASMREFVNQVAVEHPAGYDIEPVPEGERFRGAWWRKVVEPVLESLEDVEKPSGGGKWRYTGEE